MNSTGGSTQREPRMPRNEPNVYCGRVKRPFPYCHRCRWNPERAKDWELTPGAADWFYPGTDSVGDCKGYEDADE